MAQAPILSARQFKALRPSGTYSAYLSFVARRREVTVAALKKSAPAMSAKKFDLVKVKAGAAAGGRPAPAANAGGGGGRMSQTPAQLAKRGYMKWGGKRYAPGDADELWMDMALKGQSYDAWADRWPKLAQFLGPVSAMSVVERQIRQGFQKVGSPLAKFAHLFVLAGKLAGYDPRFLASLAAQESGWGRSTPANAPHNYWGWSVYTGRSSSAVASPFQNPGSAFRYIGNQLRENYGGAKTVYDQVWSPYAADPAHEAKIAAILRNSFGGNPYDIRLSAAGR